MESVYDLKNMFLMDVERSFLGTARGDEAGVNEVSWLRKDFLVNEDSSAEGAVHQRRQYTAGE